MSTDTPGAEAAQAPHRQRFHHQETLPADSPERIARRMRNIRIGRHRRRDEMQLRASRSRYRHPRRPAGDAGGL